MSFLIPRDARSWVDVAADSDFPIQNLPFGIAEPKDRGERVVVAIGEFALDLLELGESGLIDDVDFPILDSFIEFERESIEELRLRVFRLLESSEARLRDDAKLRKRALIPMGDANLQVPIPPGSFADFYSGIHHASNVGKMFRPDMAPLLPNYRFLPIAYNGRANTVVASGTRVVRPKGQTKAPDAESPVYGPTRELDFELEVGFYISHGQDHGKRITATAAEEHVLGLVLVNDWSARDIQRWEYQPLGPFLSKSFATSVSPWLVTLDALAPFRIAGMVQDPPPLPHLRHHGTPHFDVVLEVFLKTAKSTSPQLVCRTNMSELYWSISQQVAHLTSNGTPLEFGDLYATGTISGPEPGMFGSLLEATWRGSQPLAIAETGESRTFLEDGDTLSIRAHAQRDGVRIGFGEVSGTVVPAL